MSIGANSLLIVPAGFNPSTDFAQYSSLGLTHTLGTTLTVPAGQGFGGSGLDQRSGQLPRDDHGRFRRGNQPQRRFDTLGHGRDQFGQREPDDNDLLSGISGGSTFRREPLRRQRRHGDLHADRREQQHRLQLSGSLYLGNNAGDSGTYNLGGNGQLSALLASTWATPARGASPRPAGQMFGYELSLSRLQRRQQRYVQPRRRPGSRPHDEYVGYSGTGTSRRAGGTNSTYGSLSRLQRRQQRHVQPERRPVVAQPTRIRGLFRHGDLHAVRRDQQHALATSISATTPAAAARTASAAAACSPHTTAIRGLLRHGELHAVGRDATPLPTLSISATTPAAAARTASAAAASCRPRANTSAPSGRHGLFPADRRHEHGLAAVDRQRRHVSAGRRHLAGQRQSCEPGSLRRQQHAGTLSVNGILDLIQRHVGRAWETSR